MDRARASTGVAAAIFALHTIFYWPYWIDDAYITFRYAENFAAGRGMVYNAGEAVEGLTNLGWALMLAPFVGGDLLVVAKVFGLLFGLGAVVLVGEWCRARALPLPATLAALAALVGPPWLVSYTMYGLETAAVAFFVTLAWARHGDEADGRRRAPLSALGMALAPWFRPDGALVAILVALWHLVRRGPTFSWAAARAAAIVLAGAGGLVALKLHWYGAILPNTAATKLRAWPPEQGLEYLRTFLAWPSPALSWLVVAAAGWGLLRMVRRDDRALPGMVALAGIAAGVAQNGDFMENFRFFVPVWPAVAAAIGVLVADLARLGRHLPTVAAIAAAATIVPTLEVQHGDRLIDPGFETSVRLKRWPPGADDPSVGSGQFFAHFAFPAAWSVVQRPSSVTLAYANIGVLGFMSEGYVLDLLGLTDPIMGRRFARADAQRAWEHVSETADIVMLDVPHGEWPRYRDRLGDAGWTPIDGCLGYWLFANPARTANLRSPSRAELTERLEHAFVRARNHPAVLIAIGYELAWNPGDPELFVRWTERIADRVPAEPLRRLRCTSGLDGCRYVPACDNGVQRLDVRQYADPATWPEGSRGKK